MLGAATIALLVLRSKDPVERASAAGFVAVGMGIVSVAFAIALGLFRSVSGIEHWSRESFLMWPLLGATYLIWVKAGRRWVPIGLCGAMALAFPLNMGAGMVHAASNASSEFGFEADLRARIPDTLLVHSHFPNSRNDGWQARAVQAIPMLREAQASASSARGRDTGALGWVAVEVLIAAVVGRWLFNLSRAVQVERARELFRLQQERFEERFLAAASTTGMPADCVGYPVSSAAMHSWFAMSLRAASSLSCRW